MGGEPKIIVNSFAIDVEIPIEQRKQETITSTKVVMFEKQGSSNFPM